MQKVQQDHLETSLTSAQRCRKYLLRFHAKKTSSRRLRTIDKRTTILSVIDAAPYPFRISTLSCRAEQAIRLRLKTTPKRQTTNNNHPSAILAFDSPQELQRRLTSSSTLMAVLHNSHSTCPAYSPCPCPSPSASNSRRTFTDSHYRRHPSCTHRIDPWHSHGETSLFSRCSPPLRQILHSFTPVRTRSGRQFSVLLGSRSSSEEWMFSLRLII